MADWLGWLTPVMLEKELPGVWPVLCAGPVIGSKTNKRAISNVFLFQHVPEAWVESLLARKLVYLLAFTSVKKA